KVNRNFQSLHKSKISGLLKVDTENEKQVLINELINNVFFAMYSGKKSSLHTLLLRSTEFLLKNGKTEKSAFTFLIYFAIVYSECRDNELMFEFSEYLMKNEPADNTLNARVNLILGTEVV